MLQECSTVAKDQSYGLQLLSSIPYIGKYFSTSDVKYFCDSVEVTDVMEDLQEIEQLTSSTTGSDEETLKIVFLRFHLTLSFGVKLLKSLVNKVSVHKVIKLLKHAAENDEVLTAMTAHPIGDEEMNKFRRLCNCMLVFSLFCYLTPFW